MNEESWLSMLSMKGKVVLATLTEKFWRTPKRQRERKTTHVVKKKA